MSSAAWARGYTARIAFDLDVPIGASTCVACGECADELLHRRLELTSVVRPTAAAPVMFLSKISSSTRYPISRTFVTLSLPFLRALSTRSSGVNIARRGDLP